MQEGEAPNPNTISSEGPKDNQNKIIAQLRKVSSVVSSVNQEQIQMGPNRFNLKVRGLIHLGNGYIEWLDANRDKVPDEETFRAVASLARSSLFLNFKYYEKAAKKIRAYIQSQPELERLNAPGKQGSPWLGFETILSGILFNDARERYREEVLQKAGELAETGDLMPTHFNHLKRYLFDTVSRRPGDQTAYSYIALHAADIGRWAPLSLQDFQAFVLSRLGNYVGVLSQNESLRKLEEELSSIKPNDLLRHRLTAKTGYHDRAKKLAFVRDVRFKRIDVDKLKSEIAARDSKKKQST